MATAVAKINRSNTLSMGADGPPARLVLPAERRISLPGGEVRKLAFLNQFGEKAALVIQQQRSFNLDDKYDKHNWDILGILVKLPGDDFISEQIQLIDPEKDAYAELDRNKKLVELLGLIDQHQSDEEWLRKLYRRVIGLASGIPARAMAVGLINKAMAGKDALTHKYGIDAFTDAQGSWIFESDYYETRALLDVALERQEIVVIEGNYRRKSDSTVLAHDEQKMLYVLQNDAALREYIKERVNGPVAERTRPTGLILEDSELVRLTQKLGEVETTVPINPDGTVDEKTIKARADAELSTMIDVLAGSGVITQTGESYKLDEAPDAFADKSELIGYFKSNEEVRKTYLALTKS